MELDLSVAPAWLNTMRRLFVVAVALVSCAMPAGTADRPDVSFSLVRVVDGDTVVLETRLGEERVRLSGVNAPDRGECGHRRARARLAALLDDARLALAVEGTDQFGRTLGRLEADGSDVATALVREGHGLAVAAAPNSHQLLAAEETAHALGIGMWATDACGAGSPPDVTFDPGASVTDPAGRDELELHAETMVIVNREDHAVDLSHWVLRDGSSRHRYRFGPGAVLRPGARLEVDSGDPGWSPGGSAVWSNDGDVALLLGPSGEVVARWRYDG